MAQTPNVHGAVRKEVLFPKPFQIGSLHGEQAEVDAESYIQGRNR
jgi:hypothetical protein